MTGKQRILVGAIASAGIVGAMGAATVSAATQSGSGSLASKLATAFHLNQADVQRVLDQDRADHQAQMVADEKTRLDAAVKAGTITSAQETLIINKQAELRAAHDAERNSTSDEATRESTMKAERDALTKWASDNEIPLNLLFGGHRPGLGHGPEGANQATRPAN